MSRWTLWGIYMRHGSSAGGMEPASFAIVSDTFPSQDDDGDREFYDVGADVNVRAGGTTRGLCSTRDESVRERRARELGASRAR